MLGLISAIMLRRHLAFKQLFSSIILLPNAAPEVVAGFMWISMLAGGENATLSRIVMFFGMTPTDWLQTFPLTMIIVVNTWRGIATAMILITAGLSTIPQEVYEAARMDGANPSQIFRRITLPLMMPTILLYMLISAVSTIAIFGLVYALTRGGPGGATEVIEHLHLQPVLYRLPARLWRGGRGGGAGHLADPRYCLCARHESAGLNDGFRRDKRAEIAPAGPDGLCDVVLISAFCAVPFFWVLLASLDAQCAAVPQLAARMDAQQLCPCLRRGRRRALGVQLAVRRRQRDAAGDGSGWARRLCAVAHPGPGGSSRFSTPSF